ncbi:MAG: ABC transporter permease, partial [Clostridia bacterium]|nr:ABC transporter permease [Clostridia bacterium]
MKSKNQLGFSQQEINYIENQFSHHNIMKTFCYETYINDELVRVYSYDIENANINKLQIVEGNFPKAGNEIVVERKTSKINGYELGQEITLNNNKFTVCGIVLNPLILNQVEEPSFQYENKHIENVIYINTNNNFITNDIYIALENRLLFDSFSKNYKQTINNTKTQIINELGEENVSVLGLSENFGIYSLVSYAEKVGLIGIIFVVFFLLVTLLVVYSTMSRLIEEERSHIACQKTLGCSDTKIIVKYILFVLFATLVGGLLAFGVGLALTKIIYSAFNLQYAMPPFPTSANFVYYLLTFVIILLATTILTTLTAVKIIRHKPVVLLTPKAPKKGKKVFMEKIPFVWNRLSFKYKSTFRNVLLFKSRFLMTVVSVIGATVLVFAGLGLMDCATKIDGGSSLITISAALIVFSAILCALVIYNLTNINVSERSREISTLMVLGYNNKEITGYIFRE